MSKYGNFERTVAKKIERYPNFRNTIKKIYKRINYWAYGEKEFCYEMHPKADIKSLDYCWESKKWSYFFGYYDKSPWYNESVDYILMHIIKNEKVEITRAVPKKGVSFSIGKSRAWNYQQGSMTQWLKKDHLIYNDINKKKLGSKIVSKNGKIKKFIPWPIQTVHPRGCEALSLNYKRLQDQRPEYGYKPPVTNFSSDMLLNEDGLWRVSLKTGGSELILSLSDLRDYKPRPEMEDARHRVNHAMYSPGGTRIVFMHRWIGDEGKFSRLYVSAPNGEGLRLLMDDRVVSHYSWRDENHLVVWGRTEEWGTHYYLVDVRDGTQRILGKEIIDQFGDGHPSYSPGGRWIVTDTYPDKARQRHLLLFDTRTETVLRLGRFFAPWSFEGTGRCDLHPRWGPDGNYISIDSAHEGRRKSYIINLEKIMNIYE